MTTIQFIETCVEFAVELGRIFSDWKITGSYIDEYEYVYNLVNRPRHVIVYLKKQTIGRHIFYFIDIKEDNYVASAEVQDINGKLQWKSAISELQKVYCLPVPIDKFLTK
jgi:hypothetical protein